MELPGDDIKTTLSRKALRRPTSLVICGHQVSLKNGRQLFLVIKCFDVKKWAF